MSVNGMTIEQASAFLSAVVAQMDGGALASVSPGNFTSVAQNALLSGYDPLSTAISQVIGRTIFSIRPYNGKLKFLWKDDQKFGGMIRKVNYLDGVLEDDQGLYYSQTTAYTNGQVPTPDQYAIRKPAVWQSNFYAWEQYQRVTTRFLDQLDMSLRGPEEFGQFLAGQMQNISDQLEEVNDAKARQCLINFIGGKIRLDTTDVISNVKQATHVIHLLTEYNAQTGASLTAANYTAPANYKPFVEWLFARVATLADMMSERGRNFNFSPKIGATAQTATKAWIKRHTPKSKLKAVFIASEFNRIQSMAISEVFNKDELRMIDFEPINYWQSSADPMNIVASVAVNNGATAITGPTVNDLETASITTKGQSSNPDKPVIGVLYDEDALGLSVVSEGVYTTPMHITGKYWNTAYHFNTRVLNDFTESGVVLMLD